MDVLVRNAADRKQTRHADRKLTDERKRQLAELAEVLDTRAGRRFLWRVIAECGLYKTPYDTRGDLTHQNIGKMEIGRFIVEEINEANDDAWITMQLENRDEVRRMKAEAEAVRTPRQGESDDV